MTQEILTSPFAPSAAAMFAQAEGILRTINTPKPIGDQADQYLLIHTWRGSDGMDWTISQQAEGEPDSLTQVGPVAVRIENPLAAKDKDRVINTGSIGPQTYPYRYSADNIRCTGQPYLAGQLPASYGHSQNCYKKNPSL